MPVIVPAPIFARALDFSVSVSPYEATVETALKLPTLFNDIADFNVSAVTTSEVVPLIVFVSLLLDQATLLTVADLSALPLIS